ncbi:C40 family peptidase [Dactylosporangium sp. AC04546]|uniref:C40 family peptidase n=1 Tax=Dactylosporangium sp. AC04546 TaxID=2862460 RepID=UPI001EDF9724|nr:C40 family peptidase [Dactylosporangium sp. AC04546]WVK86766.1 C40 family peptidase [Dactylosporangium sp. AC04546]
MDGLVLRTAYPGDDWTPEPLDPEPLDQVVEPAFREPRRYRRGPFVAAAVVCTMLCALVARPASADPGQSIPDTGSRPIVSGDLVMPGQSAAPATVPSANISTSALHGPFAAQLAAAEAAVTALGQRRLQASLHLEAAQATLTDAEEKLRLAASRVADLRSKADSAAADAYKRAAGLGPLDEYAHDVHQFELLVPGLGGQPGGQAAARDLLRAEQEEAAAKEKVDLARSTVQTSQRVYTPIDADFNAKNAAYLKLKSDNEAAVLRIEAAQDEYEQSLGGPSLPANPIIDGMQANPKAIQALSYAMSKIGSWYVWGDEGPNTFDCSGLAYWAYGQVGARVPRVANDMYHGTPNIRPTKNRPGDQLLPGDLVFFANDLNDWRSIYHMGIYIGNGKMVVAPTTGQKVKVSPVRWSRLFGASRIFPAVPAPNHTTPPPPNPTSTTINPSPSATTSKPPTSKPPTSAPPSSAPPSSRPPLSVPPSSQPPSSQPASSQPPSSAPPSTAGASTKATESTSSAANTAAQTTSSASGN